MMDTRTCLNCGKETPWGHNYCPGSDCMIEHAKKQGGTVHCPNGLPIRSIKHDNSMWEHEHGDHPDYKFPVTADYVGNNPERFFWISPRNKATPMTPEEKEANSHETHALIYADGNIAVTIYECCYAMWYLWDGAVAGGNLWKKNEWKLSGESLRKIKEKFKCPSFAG